MLNNSIRLFINSIAEKCRREREQERREQYKQVRAHVKKDDGRMQAYGWSLPAKFGSSSASTTADQKKSTSHVPVPVPVYCHPLLSKEPGIRVSILKFHELVCV